MVPCFIIIIIILKNYSLRVGTVLILTSNFVPSFDKNWDPVAPVQGPLQITPILWVEIPSRRDLGEKKLVWSIVFFFFMSGSHPNFSSVVPILTKKLGSPVAPVSSTLQIIPILWVEIIKLRMMGLGQKKTSLVLPCFLFCVLFPSSLLLLSHILGKTGTLSVGAPVWR